MGNISALSTTSVVKTATITPILLPAGSYFIGAYNANGDGHNYLNLGYGDNSPSSHAGNGAFDNHSGGWTALTSLEHIFYLYGSKNFTLTTKGSDSLTATSPASAPTKGYFQALLDEKPKSGTSVYTKSLPSAINGGWQGYSLRNIIKASDISAGGDRIRITLNSRTTGVGKLDNIAIVERSGATSNGTTTPTEILFGGSSGVELGAGGGTIISDWLDYTIDATKDYLLIMDVIADAAKDDFQSERTTGSGLYYVSGNSYNVANMPGSPVSQATVSQSLSKIEVGVDQVVNTDYIAEMSRDGGTTYSPVVLNKIKTNVVGTSKNILGGESDFAGDPSGTNIVGRVRSINKDKITVHGVSVNWS